MKSKLLITAGALLFLGCSMMPYHEDFKCQGGSDIAICQRVSDVYLKSDEINQPKPKKTALKTDNNCTTLKKENRLLKDMVEAVKYNELKNPVEIVIIKECQKTSSPKKILNKTMKVCVLNANVRELPNCKSKILKIVKKGEKVFAYYEKDGWIKIKGGYIHKSLLCGECKQKEARASL